MNSDNLLEEIRAFDLAPLEALDFWWRASKETQEVMYDYFQSHIDGFEELVEKVFSGGVFAHDRLTVEDLKGCKLSKVETTKEKVVFTLRTGTQFQLCHLQNCCEYVYLEDVSGDLSDLENSTLLMVEETSNPGPKDPYESRTWTFYKFATILGYVTLRFLGSSNGHYSESVDFCMCDDGGPEVPERVYGDARDVNAREVDSGRNDTRASACISPEYAYSYARDVDKGPHEDTRASDK